MAPPEKTDDHELPTLTDLEAENIIVRRKQKGRKKPVREFETENEDRPPERTE